MEGLGDMPTEPDFEDDFGFSDIEAVDEQEVRDSELPPAKEMYKLISPLLDRLEKDADTKPMINWPGRAKSINTFRRKLAKIAQVKLPGTR